MLIAIFVNLAGLILIVLLNGKLSDRGPDGGPDRGPDRGQDTLDNH